MINDIYCPLEPVKYRLWRRIPPRGVLFYIFVNCSVKITHFTWKIVLFPNPDFRPAFEVFFFLIGSLVTSLSENF